MMDRKILFTTLLILFGIQSSWAQKAVIGLPKMNVIYIGLDNPVNIAVEGCTYNDLTIKASGCELIGKYPDTYLKATNPGQCLLEVSYKKSTGSVTDSFYFRHKSIPKPKAMFGALEAGNYPAAALLGQNFIAAILPNFVYEGVRFTVTSYNWKYVNNTTYTVCSDSVKGGAIARRLKDIIYHSRGSGEILISNIKATGPGGKISDLEDLEISFGSKTFLKDIPDLIIHQNEIDSVLSYYDFEPVYGCDAYPLFPKGTIKLCKICAGDTQVMNVINNSSRRTLSEKQYYLSGNLKNEFDFEKNDSIGTVKIYYDNGRIKSMGKVIIRKENISELYQPRGWMDPNSDFIDSFVTSYFAPVGIWKGFYEDGTFALDCSFGLEGFKDLDYEFRISGCGNHETAFYSIAETIKHPQNHFYPALNAPLKIYNRDGTLRLEENYGIYKR